MTNDGNGENPNGAALFEAANKLRGSVESAEYKHLVLGLLFLKYISDSFTLRREQLEAELADPTSDLYTEDAAERDEVLEDRDEYVAENVFWVPPDARWEDLLAAAQQPDIARRIDHALEAIENENPRLRNVLPRIYSRAPLSPELMGSLVQTIAKIASARAPSRRATCSGARTSTSSRSSRERRATAAASSSPPHRSRGCWLRCSSPTRAACSTRRALPRNIALVLCPHCSLVCVIQLIPSLAAPLRASLLPPPHRDGHKQHHQHDGRLSRSS